MSSLARSQNIQSDKTLPPEKRPLLIVTDETIVMILVIQRHHRAGAMAVGKTMDQVMHTPQGSISSRPRN
jgi:hypothetical protein